MFKESFPKEVWLNRFNERGEIHIMNGTLCSCQIRQKGRSIGNNIIRSPDSKSISTNVRKEQLKSESSNGFYLTREEGRKFRTFREYIQILSNNLDSILKSFEFIAYHGHGLLMYDCLEVDIGILKTVLCLPNDCLFVAKYWNTKAVGSDGIKSAVYWFAGETKCRLKRAE